MIPQLLLFPKDSMKNLVCLIVLFTSVSSFANNNAAFREAANLLSSIAEQSVSFNVQSNVDVKSMISEAALAHYGVESKVEFEQSWVGSGSEAWQPDSSNWGAETFDGASGYVKTALADTLGAAGDEESAVDTYNANLVKAKKAFQILRTLKNVQYGVGPVGAVQCGIRFAALLILDTDSGEVIEIVMEGSGC